jgi:hypothetical protein
MALDRELTGDAALPLQMGARASNLPASPFWETSGVPTSTPTPASTSQTVNEQHGAFTRSSGSGVRPDAAPMLLPQTQPQSHPALRHEGNTFTLATGTDSTSRQSLSSRNQPPSHANPHLPLHATLPSQEDVQLEMALSSSPSTQRSPNIDRAQQMTSPPQFTPQQGAPVHPYGSDRMGFNGGGALGPSTSNPNLVQPPQSAHPYGLPPHSHPPHHQWQEPYQGQPPTSSHVPPHPQPPFDTSHQHEHHIDERGRQNATYRPPEEDYVSSLHPPQDASGQSSTALPQRERPNPSQRTRHRALSQLPEHREPIPWYRFSPSRSRPQEDESTPKEDTSQDNTNAVNMSSIIEIPEKLLQELLAAIREFWNIEIRTREERLANLSPNQIEERKALNASISRIQQNIVSLPQSFSDNDIRRLAILLRDVERQNSGASRLLEKIVSKYGGNTPEMTTKLISMLLSEMKQGRTFLATASGSSHSQPSTQGGILGTQPPMGLHDATAHGALNPRAAHPQPIPSTSQPLLVQGRPPDTDTAENSASRAKKFQCGDPQCQDHCKWMTPQDALEHLVNHHLFSKECTWKCFSWCV